MSVGVFSRKSLLRCRVGDALVRRSDDDRAELCFAECLVEEHRSRDLDGIRGTERVSIPESDSALDDIFFHTQ